MRVVHIIYQSVGRLLYAARWENPTTYIYKNKLYINIKDTLYWDREEEEEGNFFLLLLLLEYQNDLRPYIPLPPLLFSIETLQILNSRQVSK